MAELAPALPLAHGASIPQIGLGTWPMDDRAVERAVAEALELGYRHVDTAEAYGNEAGVGAGVRASGVPREDVFVTTKFQKRWHGRDLVGEALNRSCDRLGLDYVDLLLFHWPNPSHDRYVDGWEGMLELLGTGRLRAVGTANFKAAHLQRIIDATGVAPDLNQIELNPTVTRDAVRAFHAEHGILTEAYSPFGGGGAEVLRRPEVERVAEECGRSPGQVVLRWLVQQGVVTIPKSNRPDRMRENLAVFDFELTQAQLASLSALDEGEAAAIDSDRVGH